ncbi:MAG: high-affinity branched-chain amino acid ABC transporter permease LivM [Magnetococcales bacterium]|nr:high-affinity branched-chain amino acid ABC transporter permease LivM [Magnetococcales bacterium]MBF0322228.1 high-affinity branched-chain amino acid ABC transporter permease LivM [Magnetococcales bacterium]
MNFREAWRVAVQWGGVALLLFTPLSGLVLDGYRVVFFWQRPLWLAGGVFLGALLTMMLLQASRTPRMQRFFTRMSSGSVVERQSALPVWQGLLLFAVAAGLPWWMGHYWLNVMILALIYALLGLGINIVVGLAGLLDLGYVAFYAVGAYGYALGSQYLGLGFWSAIPFCALLAATFGALLGFPVLRMRGDYLAIVTLGFGEIIRLVLNNATEITGGPNGLSVPAPTILGLELTRVAKQGGTPWHEFFKVAYDPSVRSILIYLVLLVFLAMLYFFVGRLQRMPIGRAWEALREDEIACRALGINHVTVKLSAFAMGAAVGGMGGVFFAASQGFVNPTSFTFFESALILAMVVLGGLGSNGGVVVAALTINILHEVLREFSDYRGLVFGLIMVIMMIWRPRGLLRIRRPFFPVGKAL